MKFCAPLVDVPRGVVPGLPAGHQDRRDEHVLQLVVVVVVVIVVVVIVVVVVILEFVLKSLVTGEENQWVPDQYWPPWQHADLEEGVAQGPYRPRLQEGGPDHVPRQVVRPPPQACQQVQQVHLQMFFFFNLDDVILSI